MNSSLSFSLDVAVKSMELFENTFGVAYPLSKLDLFPIPDFSGMVFFSAVHVLSKFLTIYFLIR
jgi:aminopeptidase N